MMSVSLFQHLYFGLLCRTIDCVDSVIFGETDAARNMPRTVSDSATAPGE